MSREQEIDALIIEWEQQGWSEEEIQSSLIAYFGDSPTFVDDSSDA